MKILLCGSRGVPAQYGGFESLAENLALNMARAGLQVVVSGFNSDLDSIVESDESGVVSFIAPTKAPRLLQNFLATRKITKLLDRIHKFDAVIVLNDVNFFVARRYHRNGVPTVLHLDGAEAKRSGLPVVGKLTHWFFRRLASRNGLHLVVDSESIKAELNLIAERISVIRYGPHVDKAVKPINVGVHLESGDFFLVVARFVEENQLIEIIEGFIASNRWEKLLLIGSGTGGKKYEDRVRKSALKSRNIYVLPKNYNRAEINWLLENAKGYIHGHSVGGTNPILIDARKHSKLILAHDNPFNREESGSKEHFWSDSSNLSDLLNNLKESTNTFVHNDYQLETWESITLQYLKLLTKVK